MTHDELSAREINLIVALMAHVDECSKQGRCPHNLKNHRAARALRKAIRLGKIGFVDLTDVQRSLPVEY